MQPLLSDKDSYIKGGIDVHLKRYLKTLGKNKENNKSKHIKTTIGQILCQDVSSRSVSSDHCQGQVYVENGGSGNKSTKEANQETAIDRTIASEVPGNALDEVDIHNKPDENSERSLKNDCENYLDFNEPLTTDSHNLWIGSPVADENSVNETDSDQSSTTTLSDRKTTLGYDDFIPKTDSSSDSLLDLLGAKIEADFSRIEAELQKHAPEEYIIDLTDDN